MSPFHRLSFVHDRVQHHVLVLYSDWHDAFFYSHRDLARWIPECDRCKRLSDIHSMHESMADDEKATGWISKSAVANKLTRRSSVRGLALKLLSILMGEGVVDVAASGIPILSPVQQGGTSYTRWLQRFRQQYRHSVIE